jgi:hypothetical protein
VKRMRKQPHPQQVVRFGPGAHGALLEATTAAQGQHDDAPPVVGAGAPGVTKVRMEEQEEEGETLAQQRHRIGLFARVPAPGPRATLVIIKVEDSSNGEDAEGGEEDSGEEDLGEEEMEQDDDDGNVNGGTAGGEVYPITHGDGTSRFKGVCWEKGRGKWRASCKGVYLGNHATKEVAARAYINYAKDGVVPEKRRERTSPSEIKGVCWHKRAGKWAANCEGKHLEYHTMEEAAAHAYNDYVEDGVDPVKRREGKSSQFKGVFWDKGNGKWTAKCRGKHLGYHATEEAAAQAYDDYDKDGVDPVKRRERPPVNSRVSVGTRETGNGGRCARENTLDPTPRRRLRRRRTTSKLSASVSPSTSSRPPATLSTVATPTPPPPSRFPARPRLRPRTAAPVPNAPHRQHRRLR